MFQKGGTNSSQQPFDANQKQKNNQSSTDDSTTTGPGGSQLTHQMSQMQQGSNAQGMGTLGNQGMLMQQLQQQQFENQQHIKTLLNNNNVKSDSMVNNLNQLLLQQYQAQNKTSTGGDGQLPSLMGNDHIQKILQNQQNKGSSQNDQSIASSSPMDNLQDNLRKQIQQAQSSKSKNKSNDSSLQASIPSAYIDPKTVPDLSKSSKSSPSPNADDGQEEEL